MPLLDERHASPFSEVESHPFLMDKPDKLYSTSPKRSAFILSYHIDHFKHLFSLRFILYHGIIFALYTCVFLALIFRGLEKSSYLPVILCMATIFRTSLLGFIPAPS